MSEETEKGSLMYDDGRYKDKKEEKVLIIREDFEVGRSYSHKVELIKDGLLD